MEGKGRISWYREAPEFWNVCSIYCDILINMDLKNWKVFEAQVAIKQANLNKFEKVFKSH